LNIFVKFRNHAVSLAFLKQAVADNDKEKLIRYVRLHFGDGNEKVGSTEIDKGWIEALKLMIEMPETNRQFILDTIETESDDTLAHLYFHLHFHFVKQSGEWIHDGNL